MTSTQQQNTPSVRPENARIVESTRDYLDLKSIEKYARLDDEIDKKQSELPLTSPNRKVLRRRAVERAAAQERVTTDFQKVLDSAESDQTDKVLREVRKVSPKLAGKLTDKTDLFHHEKYLEKIKQKYTDGKIRRVSDVSKPEIASTVSSLPSEDVNIISDPLAEATSVPETPSPTQLIQPDINDLPVIPEQVPEKTDVIVEEAPPAASPEIDTVPEFASATPEPENNVAEKPDEPVPISASPTEISPPPDKQAEVPKKPQDETIETKLSNFFKLYGGKGELKSLDVAKLEQKTNEKKETI